MQPRRMSLTEHWMVTMVCSFFCIKQFESRSSITGTIMCYGQTGAGKTHTMTGFAESYPNRGIIPRALQHLFQEITNRQDSSYTVR